VAFGASLLNGKVLDDFGFGSDSGIIAGMEWAAKQKARVVNMSLGGFPTDGTDPMSQAITRLTARYRTLFVVAAGNSGPGEQTVENPGVATEALTVGAVDAEDQLADFSGRGPRFGDYAMKPDITAPGVDIIAARAAGTALGDPVNQWYTRLTGTSMATPHVAGAAAIMAQRWPSLDPGPDQGRAHGHRRPQPRPRGLRAGRRPPRHRPRHRPAADRPPGQHRLRLLQATPRPTWRPSPRPCPCSTWARPRQRSTSGRAREPRTATRPRPG
jgi:subtilisin family serine protease